jgi:hypothetical protein
MGTGRSHLQEATGSMARGSGEMGADGQQATGAAAEGRYGILPRLLYVATGTDVALMAWGWAKQARGPGDPLMEVLLQVRDTGDMGV